MEDPIKFTADATAAGYEALSVWAKITHTHIAYGACGVCGILIALFAWRFIQKRRRNAIQAA